ncbi:S1 family peptidase [Streptomyces sp. 5-10]|uniref:S1 family peptidase n=1 Tax=Streptomyces sp. 5-10 TaxID=878925 RepID=UPI00168B250A|nr:S1 family peptidase [Streptomyces sp. 5-10]MBD3002562.1 S1 family peptidase [Streptomyces sp. 5-10]
MHLAGIAATVGALLTVFLSPGAEAVPAPLTDPAKAAAVAAKLGDDRTAGIYYKGGRLTIAVTDPAAAESVQDAGGTAEVVTHSKDELASIHTELDRLTDIPNTAWGVDPSSNQVSVEIFDGVSAADRARIEEVAAPHGDAVRIEKLSGKLERTDYAMRGGVGIVSDNRLCSSAFNVQNDSGKKFMLTAGHCMVGGYYAWSRYGGGIKLGTMVDWEWEPGDWAIVGYTNPDVTPYGTVQYKDGSEGQIKSSRWVVDGEKAKRAGTRSQDLDGIVLKPSTTVNYPDDGVTLYNMIETSHCSVRGDSGGAMFAGTAALGITSGGNYVDEPCGDTDPQPDRHSLYHPVQDVIISHNLAVY